MIEYYQFLKVPIHIIILAVYKFDQHRGLAIWLNSFMKMGFIGEICDLSCMLIYFGNHYSPIKLMLFIYVDWLNYFRSNLYFLMSKV